MKKFRLTEDRFEYRVGTVMYQCTKPDYGLARDDTRAIGIEHICVTEHPDGDYPFITVPITGVEEIED